MKHSFWDQFSDLGSPVHRLSPDIKLAVLIMIIAVLSVMPGRMILPASIPLTAFLLSVMIISGVPAAVTVKRTLVILPLVVPIILLNSVFIDAGLNRSLVLSIRAFISIFAMVLLVSVTRFSDILRTLERWHFPGILIMILSFMYRYFFLLTEEMEKMVRAVKLRSGKRGGMKMFRVYGQVLAILFIKSYERSERVYHAMLMRGYDGRGRLQ